MNDLAVCCEVSFARQGYLLYEGLIPSILLRFTQLAARHESLLRIKSNITDNESAKMPTAKGAVQGHNYIAMVDSAEKRYGRSHGMD